MAVLSLHSLRPPRIPEGAVYIGRANPRLGLRQSPFANPFIVKGRRTAAARAEVIEQYREWLWGEIRSERFTLEDLVALDGKHLVCYCAPMACHGDVLQKAVRWAVKRKAALEAGEQVEPLVADPGSEGPAALPEGDRESSAPSPGVSHTSRPPRLHLG